jgi:HD-GYP domain-containing protein (c-di-GMP phosphodiesterase class II)
VSKFNINLYQAVYALSDALDLVGVDQINHSKRVTYVAMACGKALNWERPCLEDLFLASVLHDCGVSNTAIHTRLTDFEVRNAGNHCAKGADLLHEAPLLAHLSDYILHHHTAWSELIGLDLPDKVKRVSNCIYLADRVDILLLNALIHEPNILASKNAIRRKIKAKKDDWFQPNLVDIFLSLSEAEAFWLAMERQASNAEGDWQTLWDSIEPVEFTDLKDVVLIFSKVIDAKSAYTAHHSRSVAQLSRLLGSLFKITEDQCERLELAALLHDLGMLRVPDAIVNKPLALTEAEKLVIHRHSFDTHEILKNIAGFETISQWASQHHERNNGQGYPYRNHANELAIEAKILAVADVFQALTQKRPYRNALSSSDLLQILQAESRIGQLDAEVVAMVETHFSLCWQAAVSLG